MSDKRYTILIVPETPGRVKRVILNSRAVRIGITIALSAVLVFSLMTAVAVVSTQRLAELKQLRRQTQAQKEQLLIFTSKLEDLRHTLDRVSEFDAKLRVITNVGDPGATTVAGTGGPSPSDAFTGGGAAGDGNFIINRIHRDLDELSHAARSEERSIQELSSFFQDQRSLLSATPSVWPTRGWVTSTFGGRLSPHTGTPTVHDGLDIAAAIGTPVRSAADGIVTHAAVRGGYGKIVMLDHGYGLATRYAHLSEIHVKPGQRVRRGDRIGSVGNTGRSTGPHLHYEVRVNNLPVNPRRYILN